MQRVQSYYFSNTTRSQNKIILKDPIHLSENHLPEITFSRKTLGRNYINPNVHFPERSLARIYISLNVPLPEITFPWTCTCQNLHFPEGSLGRNYTCQNLHLAEITFPQKLIFQNFHAYQNLYLAEIAFSRKLIFQKLYTSAQNFNIDKIYITKICNYNCSFSKIIKLRLMRRTKGAKEGNLSRLVTNFDKQR